MADRFRNPSSRPIRDQKIIGPRIYNPPLEGFITPRLQKREIDAIGFVHSFEKDDE